MTLVNNLTQLFDHCYDSLTNGEYTAKTFTKNSPELTGKLKQEQAIEETMNSLLYLASQKLKDKRFKKVYDYVLIPNGPAKLKKIVDQISYLDIMNFISPGSEGFPENNKKEK